MFCFASLCGPARCPLAIVSACGIRLGVGFQEVKLPQRGLGCKDPSKVQIRIEVVFFHGFWNGHDACSCTASGRFEKTTPPPG
jgi:hypothetical protein